MKLGLFGGSFDPVHLGHLLVAQAAVEELGLDRLFFIPAAQSPFKPENPPAPAAVRLQLLRLALAGKTHCEVDDQEIRRGGISYTVDTLREPAELAKLAEFIAVPRPGGLPAVYPPPFRGRTLKGFPVAISSSQIRARVKAGLPVENLVPPFVAGAIRTARLYV